MDGWMAQVIMFAGNFAPRNWSYCHGQLLSISANSALFSLLGTTYGGDGRTTFGLPDLRGRTPMGAGNGPGLTPRAIGEKLGTETVTLTTNQIPHHQHLVKATSASGNSNSPANAHLATFPPGTPAFATSATDDETMDSDTISFTGGGQSHNNIQPSLVLHYVICIYGNYPSRS